MRDPLTPGTAGTGCAVHLSGVKPVRMTRRQFLRAAALGMVAAGAWGLAEPFLHTVERVRVPIRGLPPGLQGLRIALLTDIHVGHFAGPEAAEAAVAATNRLQPDLTVFTGDLIHGASVRAELAPAAAALGQLRAPLGAYAVVGNHDLWHGGGRRVQQALERAGVPVLHNLGLPVQTGGERIWLAGVDDAWVGNPDPEAAMRDAPSGALRILLCHEPDFADAAARLPVPPHLQLSGHSHGGQVRLPFVGALHLPWGGRKYDLGLRRVEGSEMQVYTSRGLGVTGPPVRFNCPPEITLLELAGA